MKRSIVDLLNVAGLVLVAAMMVFSFYYLFIEGGLFGGGFSRSEGLFFGSGNIIETESETGSITAEQKAREVQISNISGLIEVRGWDGDDIRLDYVKRGAGPRPEIGIAYTADSMIIKAVYPKVVPSMGTIDFTLMIPQSVYEVDVNNVSGRVIADAIPQRIDLEISTVSGDTESASSGDLSISTVSGSVNFTAGGGDIDINTTSGRINGRILSMDFGTEIDVDSTSGSVSLDIPDNAGAELDLHSVSGSVSSRIPVSVTESKKNSIEGIIGGGGASIEVGTVSGAIRIE